MNNRRNFLLTTTLAAGSLIFLKPLKLFAVGAEGSPDSFNKLTILNLNDPISLSERVSAASIPQWLIQNNSTPLLLNTGGIAATKNLDWLAKMGCDAIVTNDPGYTEKFDYCNQLQNVPRFTSLTGNGDATTDNLFPNQIVMKGNIKVGIIGNTIGGDDRAPVDEIALRLNNTAKYLRKARHCNLVVAMNPVTNCDGTAGRKREKKIAALTENIDVIVSSNNSLHYATTYVVKNALRQEVIINYQGNENSNIKGIDISFNSKMEKSSFAVRRIV